MGLCAFGGTYVRGDGRGDRHWCNLAHRPQVWHLPHCLLPQHGTVLLEQQRDGEEKFIGNFENIFCEE